MSKWNILTNVASLREDEGQRVAQQLSNGSQSRASVKACASKQTDHVYVCAKKVLEFYFSIG